MYMIQPHRGKEILTKHMMVLLHTKKTAIACSFRSNNTITTKSMGFIEIQLKRQGKISTKNQTYTLNCSYNSKEQSIGRNIYTPIFIIIQFFVLFEQKTIVSS